MNESVQSQKKGEMYSLTSTGKPVEGTTALSSGFTFDDLAAWPEIEALTPEEIAELRRVGNES